MPINESVLIGGFEKREIKIADYDPAWPAKFQVHSVKIHGALGDTALQVEHIGSTSVLNLAAKPIIDILLVVEDSGIESSYLPQLEAAGYVLRVREPDFHEHRDFEDTQNATFTFTSTRPARQRSTAICDSTTSCDQMLKTAERA